MSRLTCICLLVLSMFPVLIFGQRFVPEYNEAFLQDEVANIYVTIDPEDFEAILDSENVWSDFEYPATFVYESSLGIDTVENIGFRLRGNTSRQAAKKSFKVSFNAYTQGQKFMGLEKMNLNGEQNDPSLIRSRVNWKILRELGLVASRTSQVKLFVNDEYRGLYHNVEHIDEEFIQKRFPSESGNLYKCQYGSNLDYLGPNSTDYQIVEWGRRRYELKTNEDLDDYRHFAHFIDILNNTSDDNFPCEIEKVLNVDEYLKTLAYEVMSGHWDGYAWNMNNFYMYHHPVENRFYFISYDLDNTLGIDWVGQNWATKNPYEWGNQNRPLYSRMMENDRYRQQFTTYLKLIQDEYFDSGLIQEYAQTFHSLISEAALEDEFRTQDFGFSTEDFLISLTASVADHVDYGVVTYLSERSESLELQLTEETKAVLPIAFHGWDNKFLVNLPDAQSVEVAFAIDGIEQSTQIVQDAGDFPDELASDGIYTWSPQVPTGYFVQAQFRAQIDGEWTDWSCSHELWMAKNESAGLVINEVMPSNTDVISDSSGDYADWIEIYNNSDSPISLSGFYLSNSPMNLFEFPLPEITLESQSHFLFWADNEVEEGFNHTNFSLNSQGDEVFLSRKQNETIQIHDCIEFGTTAPNISISRIMDGEETWTIDNLPTPGSNNSIVSVPENDLTKLVIFPNPAKDFIHFSHMRSGVVLSSKGTVCVEFQDQNYLDLAFLPSGLYLLRTSQETLRLVKK